ncbi:hypothetical protein LUW75_05300 [Streptomyces sp. MRC013]|uniref:hypothetical protein n=1 Tax=Streptomyces sp. MRC013 TaxID=2898276 RepID=UPI0020260735|nr:hypothetical protein [Streptomyces sp. MRC013]URM89504.1 hypothetical protein LUW75_05300 [Streptomyces sp. MRC013]
MRRNPLSFLSALAGVVLLLLLALAPAAAARASDGVREAAEALRQGPVYVHPAAAGELSPREARALERRILDADKPLMVAVLPDTEEFPEETLLRDLRTLTGVTGVYAVRLGDAFDAGADRSVLAPRAVENLVSAVHRPGVDAATELNAFVDQSLPQVRGSAPSSWTGVPGDGAPVGGLVTIGVLFAVMAAGVSLVTVRSRNRRRSEDRESLEKLRVVVDEDITAYGEELDRLDFHPADPAADDAMRHDYERALDAYDEAKRLMAGASHPHDVRGVTEALADGRHALAVLAARREGRPLPERRAPCFFDPRHGPSVADVPWAPHGGTPRDVPVCAEDEARVRAGRDPAARQVATEWGPRPYWEAGPAYGPWAGGYYGGALLPGLLVGTMLGTTLATPVYAAEYGGDGYDTFAGGDFSGADYNPSDFGGDFGGGDFGGGDFGGGGGGDFGGGF